MGLTGAIAISLEGMGAIAHAQTVEPSPQTLLPSEQIFQRLLEVPSTYELSALRNGDNQDEDKGWPVVTQDDTSLFSPTLPSLWLNREQVYDRWGGYRLIRGWTAFHSVSGDANIIDVQLDPQYWNRLEYYPQYAVLNQLGMTAMSYGYQVRLYNSITLVGMYTCDFSSIPELESNLEVEIPVPQLEGIQCSAAIAPFVEFESSPATEDLFAPP